MIVASSQLVYAYEAHVNLWQLCKVHYRGN
jgi:hypothetical protein